MLSFVNIFVEILDDENRTNIVNILQMNQIAGKYYANVSQIHKQKFPTNRRILIWTYNFRQITESTIHHQLIYEGILFQIIWVFYFHQFPL